MTIYETAETLRIEREAMEKAAKHWGVVAEKLPKRYKIDWLLKAPNNKQGTAWAESKRRYNVRSKYPELMLSLAKWREGRQLSEDTGLPFLLLIEWDDGLFWMRAEINYPVGIGGRSDRGDPEDIEPMVFIPVDHFKRLTAITRP